MQLSVKFKPKIFLLTQHYASLRRVTYIGEFLCEFATICKNDLAYKSMTEVGSIDEKNRGSKIL
jgi:hypothetical protein